jgi:CDP-glucose 4,6-dehydratase
LSGLALAPATNPNLFEMLALQQRGDFIEADITDQAAVQAIVSRVRPEIVIHMAAQALVRRSYDFPVDTFSTNVIGTVTLLNAIRRCPETRAVLIVTSDKAYENREWEWGYRETDTLGGFDPYSASKGCAEIAAISMRRCFFGTGKHPARIATVRAGNVIGGGDWSPDRLTPDIVRGCLGSDGMVRLRNPSAVRPWQHVLDALRAYLILAEGLYDGVEGYDDAWNIGPEGRDMRPVLEVAEALVNALGRGRIELTPEAGGPHEARLLTLDCSKARERLGWRPRFGFGETVGMTADWYRAWFRCDDILALSRSQIRRLTQDAA